MKWLKNTWQTTSQFVSTYFLLLIIVFGGSYWLFQGEDQIIEPYSYKDGEMAYSQNMMASDILQEASPMMAKTSRSSLGRSSGVTMPPVFNEALAAEETDRKIIKNGSLTLEVENTETAKMLAESGVKDLGGYITNLNSWEVRPGVLAYNLTTRIPVDKLEIAIVNLTKIGEKTGENFSVQDITAQYQDTESQLKNKRARQERLRNMMERETKNLADVLSIDRELNNVLNEIERLERTQRSRDDQVTFSRLQLSLNPAPQIGDLSGPEWNVGKSWKTAVNDLFHSLRGITDRVIKLLVYAPIWIPALFILWRIKRRFFRS
jgi:hypothetical protein